ncbi:MAG: UDP-glucose 6-dehydrogenase TuaD [Phycisphaerae bacterium]|nr:UDP-glucose 6-dehydrogenase TuaD [Phycisphaerae bacterium]
MTLSLSENLGVVGMGYVGLTTACGLADAGHRVIGCDIDAARIDALSRGEAPFHETGLGDLLSQNVAAGRLRFTADLADAVESADVLMVAVPTPTLPGGGADLGIVNGVVERIAGLVPPGSQRLIVIRSTVPPGTADAMAKRFDPAGERLRFASNPEFLKEGTAVADFMRPDRVVIGVADEPTGQRLARVYAPFVRNEQPILTLSRRGAEMTKYAANVLLAGRISLINELANICQRMGVDVNEVRRGVGYDRRIGFAFLYPGMGFGGSCLPKDVAALRTLAREAGYEPVLLDAIAQVNRRQRLAPVELLAGRLGGDLASRTVAVWGLAFKPGTDDIRQSPALEAIDALLSAGAAVRAHDPAAMPNARALYGPRVAFFDDAYDALAGADALLICTEWPPFRRADFQRILSAMARPLIVDGRNLYEPDTMRGLGIEYHSVGRPPVLPPTPG